MTARDSGTGVAGSSSWHLLCTSLRFLNQLRPGFTHYDYPGIYEDQDFHHCGLEPNDNIVNYTNAIEVWTCQLGGLAEYAFWLPCHRVSYSHCAPTSLATETEHVRQRLADYTNDLLSMGVDGLRLDAAKRMSRIFTNLGPSDSLDLHIDIRPDDIANVSSRLTTKPFITQEVRPLF